METYGDIFIPLPGASIETFGEGGAFMAFPNIFCRTLGAL
jgi:hypothetical protein